MITWKDVPTTQVEHRIVWLRTCYSAAKFTKEPGQRPRIEWLKDGKTKEECLKANNLPSDTPLL